MELNIESGWKELLKEEFEKPYFVDLRQFVDDEYNNGIVFPPENQIFNAFNLCPLSETSVVILGQDPYHDVNQAHGLCFSVNEGVKIPPSLKNIYKEIQSDCGSMPPPNGNLERWARQGVLLLNATLTVKAHQAASHQNKGWEKFTDSVIKHLAREKKNIVFLLWGAHAGKKSALIDSNNHLILTSAHPSPLSSYRGFFGNKHFSQTNAYLRSKEIREVEW